MLSALVDGCSIRATARMVGVSKNTVTKLLCRIGGLCAEYQGQALRYLRCERIQCDEIWAFSYAKEKNVPESLRGQLGYGDVWTWVAMDPGSKLVVSWLCGKRDADYAREFMQDVAARLAFRVQLTTDGHKVYLNAVRSAFGNDIDYAQLVKLYGAEPDETRYSPPKCIATQRTWVSGTADISQVSTSHVERQNLTMRMAMRCFTRLTNAFSKKLENLQHAVSLHFMHYNFCRSHQTLGMTPAMAASVTDHQWSLEEIVALLEAEESN